MVLVAGFGCCEDLDQFRSPQLVLVYKSWFKIIRDCKIIIEYLVKSSVYKCNPPKKHPVPGPALVNDREMESKLSGRDSLNSLESFSINNLLETRSMAMKPNGKSIVSSDYDEKFVVVTHLIQEGVKGIKGCLKVTPQQRDNMKKLVNDCKERIKRAAPTPRQERHLLLLLTMT
ncbi:hypothetical protein YC2023_076645 [Brassica napus]